MTKDESARELSDDELTEIRQRAFRDGHEDVLILAAEIERLREEVDDLLVDEGAPPKYGFVPDVEWSPLTSAEWQQAARTHADAQYPGFWAVLVSTGVVRLGGRLRGEPAAWIDDMHRAYQEYRDLLARRAGS